MLADDDMPEQIAAVEAREACDGAPADKLQVRILQQHISKVQSNTVRLSDDGIQFHRT